MILEEDSPIPVGIGKKSVYAQREPSCDLTKMWKNIFVLPAHLFSCFFFNSELLISDLTIKSHTVGEARSISNNS
jgi:hypothetical protein